MIPFGDVAKILKARKLVRPLAKKAISVGRAVKRGKASRSVAAKLRLPGELLNTVRGDSGAVEERA